MAMTPEQIYEALNDTRERLHLEDSMAEISDANIEDIGVLPPEQINAFMGMFNLVLQERYFKVMFDAKDNPFRAFLIDMRKEGFGIRDIMQNIIDGVTPMWESASDADIAADLVAYAGDNFEQKYHTKRFEKQFKASVNQREYSKVFTAYGISQYVENKIANLNTSAEYYLMKLIIDEIAANAEGGKLVVKSGYDLNTAQGIKDTIEAVKTVMQGALIPSDDYNADGIITKAQDASFLYLVTTPDRLERITSQVLSGAFNMNLLDLSKFKVLLAPVGYDLGTVDGEDVQFVVLDRLSMPVGIRTWEMRTFPVPNTLWTNTWLSIEGIIGVNSFMTGVAFTGDFGDFQHEAGDLVPTTTLVMDYTSRVGEESETFVFVDADGVEHQPDFQGSIEDGKFLFTVSGVPLENGFWGTTSDIWDLIARDGESVSIVDNEYVFRTATVACKIDGEWSAMIRLPNTSYHVQYGGYSF